MINVVNSKAFLLTTNAILGRDPRVVVVVVLSLG